MAGCQTNGTLELPFSPLPQVVVPHLWATLITAQLALTYLTQQSQKTLPGSAVTPTGEAARVGEWVGFIQALGQAHAFTTRYRSTEPLDPSDPG